MRLSGSDHGNVLITSDVWPETHYFGRTMMRPGNRGYDCHASAAWRKDDSLVLCIYVTDEYFGTLGMSFVFAEYQGFTSGKVVWE